MKRGGLCRIAAAAALLAAAPLGGAALAGDERGPFRIGLVAEDAERPIVVGLSRITGGFEAALGQPVEVVLARDFAALIEAHERGDVDYAVYSAMAYAIAWLRCECVRPVAAPLSLDGRRGISAVLIGHAGDAAARPEPPHRVVAVGPSDSLGGMRLARAELARRDGGDLVTTDAPSLSDAVTRFAAGEASYLVGWAPAAEDGAEPGGAGVFGRLALAGLQGTDFTELWRSPLLPYGPHAVRADIDEASFDALRRFLLSLRDADPELYQLLERRHGGGFATADHGDYAPAIEIAAGLGG